MEGFWLIAEPYEGAKRTQESLTKEVSTDQSARDIQRKTRNPYCFFLAKIRPLVMQAPNPP